MKVRTVEKAATIVRHYYLCEGCGREYGSEGEALGCERRHAVEACAHPEESLRWVPDEAGIARRCSACGEWSDVVVTLEGLTDDQDVLAGLVAAIRASRADLRGGRVDQAESAFVAACLAPDGPRRRALAEAIEVLWADARPRDAPYRDLLGLVEAATARSDPASFGEAQRRAIRAALADLRGGRVDQAVVDARIVDFAECGVDITGPIRGMPPGPRRDRRRSDHDHAR